MQLPSRRQWTTVPPLDAGDSHDDNSDNTRTDYTAANKPATNNAAANKCSCDNFSANCCADNHANNSCSNPAINCFCDKFSTTNADAIFSDDNVPAPNDYIHSCIARSIINSDKFSNNRSAQDGSRKSVDSG